MQSTPSLTNVPLLKSLEYQLADLAAMWRGQQKTDAAPRIVRQYQAVLRCMVELGFHDSLDADSELPDELLPQEYLDLFRS